MEIINLIIAAIYWILPAYFANGAPVVFGGGAPLDFGKKLKDGYRIFGAGKTFKGFFAGIIAGSLIGFLQGRLELGVLLSIGALIGDLIGSFIKRRLGYGHGKFFPGLDQLSFIIFAVIFASIIEIPGLKVLITIFIITPLIHLFTNWVTYKLKLKEVPW